MRTTSIAPLKPATLISESAVLAACKTAAKAEAEYSWAAATAGYLLIEYRNQLKCPSHCETGRANFPLKHNQYSSNTFTGWLESNGIAKPTAYRWMEAAEAVARGILKLPKALPFDGAIDIEGTRVPISQALTAPEAELPDQARNFRQAFFDFMQDKTLAEATRAAVDGESPAHRITKAANGKLTGGTNGEDRKDYPAYIARKLSDVSTHLDAWKKFSSAQKETTEEAFTRVIEKWPSPLLEHLAKTIKAELQKR